MTLMGRIKVKPFLSFSKVEMLEKIISIQKLRDVSLEEARTKKAGGRTKSAIKNMKRFRGKKGVNQKSKAKKALDKLTPEQLEKITKMFS